MTFSSLRFILDEVIALHLSYLNFRGNTPHCHEASDRDVCLGLLTDAQQNQSCYR